MLAAHRRWSAVAGVLERDLQGFPNRLRPRYAGVQRAFLWSAR